MPSYDLNGNPIPEQTPGSASPTPPQQPGQHPAQSQQYDLAGNPLPQQGQPSAPPPGQAPYPQRPPYGQQPPPYGQPQGVWPPNPSYPQAPNAPGYYSEDTQAGQTLALSILAFFCFGVIFGPWSVIRANNAIAAIDAGRAHPADRGKLVAARVCGIVATVLAIILIIARIAAVAKFFSGR